LIIAVDVTTETVMFCDPDRMGDEGYEGSAVVSWPIAEYVTLKKKVLREAWEMAWGEDD
jgi:hypothetical protein